MRTAFSVVHNFALAMISCVLMIAADANVQATVQRFVTQGRAKTIVDDLYKCPVKVGNHRVSAVGQIMATDGTVITVPAETAFLCVQSRRLGRASRAWHGTVWRQPLAPW